MIIVMVSSSVPPPIVLLKYSSLMPYGSNIILTCTVEKSPAMDLPVTVNVVLLTPNGSVLTNSTQQVVENTGILSSSSPLHLISTEQSGVYECIVFISSTSPFLSDSNFTTNSTAISMHVEQI